MHEQSIEIASVPSRRSLDHTASCGCVVPPAVVVEIDRAVCEVVVFDVDEVEELFVSRTFSFRTVVHAGGYSFEQNA